MLSAWGGLTFVTLVMLVSWFGLQVEYNKDISGAFDYRTRHGSLTIFQLPAHTIVHEIPCSLTLNTTIGDVVVPRLSQISDRVAVMSGYTHGVQASSPSTLDRSHDRDSVCLAQESVDPELSAVEHKPVRYTNRNSTRVSGLAITSDVCSEILKAKYNSTDSVVALATPFWDAALGDFLFCARRVGDAEFVGFYCQITETQVADICITAADITGGQTSQCTFPTPSSSGTTHLPTTSQDVTINASPDVGLELLQLDKSPSFYTRVNPDGIGDSYWTLYSKAFQAEVFYMELCGCNASTSTRLLTFVCPHPSINHDVSCHKVYGNDTGGGTYQLYASNLAPLASLETSQA